MAATTAEKKEKKKERAKIYKTKEGKKKQMTLFAAGMSDHGFVRWGDFDKSARPQYW